MICDLRWRLSASFNLLAVPPLCAGRDGEAGEEERPRERRGAGVGAAPGGRGARLFLRVADRTERDGEAGTSSSSERSLPKGFRLEFAGTAGDAAVAGVWVREHFDSSSSSESRSLPNGFVDSSFSLDFSSLSSLTTIARLACTSGDISSASSSNGFLPSGYS